MMTTAQRHRELVADLAPERTRLRKTQMMRIGGRAATDQAGLLHHEAKVLTVAQPTWLGMVQFAFVDLRPVRLGWLTWTPPQFSGGPSRALELDKLSLETIFDQLGVGDHKRALGTDHSLGPRGRFFDRTDYF